MKRIKISVAIKAMLGFGLSINFVIYPGFRVSAAEALRASIDVKTESQYRTEASLCESAIRAIAGVATMKLATPDDLKQALAILDRARPNLKLYSSKLILMALTDSTFTNALRKRGQDRQAAEAFLKEVNTNHSLILKLDGVESLKTRMQQVAHTDAATLQKTADALKEAVQRLRKPAQARVGRDFKTADEFTFGLARWTAEPAGSAIRAQDPISIGFLILASVILAAGVTFFAALFGVAIGKLIDTQDKDALADCQRDADRDYNDCVTHANQQFFPINVLEVAACYASWLGRQKDCLLEF